MNPRSHFLPITSEPTLRRAVCAVAVGLGLAGMASSAQSSDASAIAPHRAVYDITLDHTRGPGGVTDISGRLVFEIRGSQCDGYTVNRRFVSHVSTEDAVTTSDQQLTTFEEADGSSYRFISRSYFDENLSETIDGRAIRRAGEVLVELSQPHEEEKLLPEDVLFPFQHLRLLLEAAQDGETIVTGEVFEGADAEQTIYDTTAVIGRPRDDEEGVSAPGAEKLKGLSSWHVAIAYFDHAEGLAELPKYEFSYDLYANGVSTGVYLDYGDFALRGELTSLEFIDEAQCE